MNARMVFTKRKILKGLSNFVENVGMAALLL